MNLRPSVRKVLGIAALSMAAAMPAAAAGFPDQPIRFIMPWPPGGASDISMRMVAEAVAQKIGQPIIVVNRPGAGGAIGIREIAESKPDGYTVGMIGSGAIAAQYLSNTANAMSDLQPVALFGTEPAALVARADQPFKTVAEYVKAAQAAPGKIRNGNDQPGGASYTFMALYERSLKVKANKVSYGGYAPMVTALLSGEVQTLAIAIPDVVEHYKAGKVNILGVSGSTRHFMVPDVPTFKEQGFDTVVGSFRTIAGPKGIPADRLQTLEKAFVEAMSDPAFIARAQARGFIVEPGGVAQSQSIWDALDSQLYPALKDAGLAKFRLKD